MRDLIDLIEAALSESKRAVEAFMAAVEALGEHDGTFTKVNGASIHLKPYGPTEANLMEIKVHISSRRQGRAGALLKAVCDLADKHGITLYGNAYPIRNSLHDRHMSQQELTAWYIRHGFEIADEPAMRGDNIVRYPQ